MPNDFATTVEAYRTFLHESALDERIAEVLSGLNTGDVGNLQHHAMIIRHMILESPLPDALSKTIVEAYHHMCDADQHQLADLAVRSSVTAADLPDASFAGQHAATTTCKSRCRSEFNAWSDQTLPSRA